MNKQQMIDIIKKYLACKFECDISELDKKGLNIVKNKQDCKLKMLLFYDLILVSSSENMYDYATGDVDDWHTLKMVKILRCWIN